MVITGIFFKKLKELLGHHLKDEEEREKKIAEMLKLIKLDANNKCKCDFF